MTSRWRNLLVVEVKAACLLTRGIECLVPPWESPPSQWHDIYNLNLKVKKEKKQSNYTNPDPRARIVGSRNIAAIYMDGIATTALFDTGAEIQLVSKQFCEENDLEIQPIEKLTECSTMNWEVFGYEGFVEVNVQISGRDFSENHLFLVISEISHQKEIPVVLGTYFIDSLSRY